MAFPDIHKYPNSYPGPYERQMGIFVVGLLGLFTSRMLDTESNNAVLQLVATPSRWSAAHAVFDEIRSRLLAAVASKDKLRECQYHFEESCCQAVYNATCPIDAFDPASAFFVVGHALGLARMIGIPVDAVALVMAPCHMNQ